MSSILKVLLEYMGKKPQRGQILLIVVLTMIVALTVGLSVAARIVTELKLSKQNEESQRAFQAAESGIQQTLIRQSSIGSSNAPITFDNNAEFSTTYTIDAGTAIVMNNGLDVDQAVGADVWLSDYSPNPALQYLNPMGGSNPVTMTLYWGSTDQDDCNSNAADARVAPAIEVVVLQGPTANPTILKNVFESEGCSRITNAKSGTTTGGPFTLKGTRFRNSAQLVFGPSDVSLSNGLIMKVIPIYNSTVIGFQTQDTVDPSDPYIFPSQGAVVASTGKAGDTVRKVVYYKSFPQMPLEVFPYSLLSQ